jgi:hypothetical protein
MVVICLIYDAVVERLIDPGWLGHGCGVVKETCCFLESLGIHRARCVYCPGSPV